MNTPRTASPQTKFRKATLAENGFTYQDLADAADVTWRMVKFWIDGQRTSARIEQALARLIANRTKHRIGRVMAGAEIANAAKAKRPATYERAKASLEPPTA